MAFFGKIFGGIAGFATSGPMGALLGAALGHAADRKTLLNFPLKGLANHFQKGGKGADFNGAATFIAAKIAAATGNKEQVLGICMIILSAKLAKCDGPVNRTEIDTFKRYFFISPHQQKQVAFLFDQARQRVDDYEKFAYELTRVFAHEKSKLENLLILLFLIARSDAGSMGILHAEEEKFLQRIHQIFNLPGQVWDYANRGKIPRSNPSELNAYKILGITSNASNEEIRITWRRLVRQYHPDSLTAQGANTAEIKRSADKIAQINAAWDQIKRDRGI